MKDNSTYLGHGEDENLPDFYRKNPFYVPESYFSQLTSQIKSNIQPNNSLLNKNNPFTTPTNYFEDLRSSLLIDIKKDGLFRKTGFTIPDDYFESTKQMIIQQVKLSTILDPDINAFQTPPNYFGKLHSTIMQKVGEDKGIELTESDGFAIPETYFDQAKQSILSKIIAEQGNKSISEKLQTPIRSIINYTTWMKYVAAACLLTVLGIGSYRYLAPSEQQVSLAQHTELAAISDEEIANYLAYSGDAEDHIFFSKYTDEEDVVEESTKKHIHDKDGICEKVKEEDIEDYLNYML